MEEETVVVCLVCGDRSSGRHYGVLTCDGCRGFFKRSVRRCLGYVCREKNKCVVDLSRRNQCQACRMKKCLAVGMRKEAVQHERAPRLGKCRSNEFSPYPRLVHYPNVTTSLPERVIHHRPKHASPLTPPHTPKQQILISSASELYQLSVRILYEAITWARNIPTFTSLSIKDQTLLLERSWCEMFLLSLSQCQIPLEIDLLIQIGRNNKKDILQGNIDKEIISDLVHLQSVIHKFKTIGLDPIEFSCLKAIILFKPDLTGIKSRNHVENLQEQAQLMLQDYTLSRGVRTRFGKILLKLPLLTEIESTLVEKHFFKGRLENINTDRSWSKLDVNNNSNNNISNDDEEEIEIKIDLED